MTATDGRYGRVGECGRCQEPVRWGITSTGKRMPLNPEPDDTGNITLTPRFRGEPPLITVHGSNAIARAEAGDDPVWKSHFATCRS